MSLTRQRPQTATAANRPLSGNLNYQQQRVIPAGSIQEMRKSRAASQLSQQATPFSYLNEVIIQSPHENNFENNRNRLN